MASPSPTEKAIAWPQKLGAACKSLTIIVVNCLLLFAAINLIIALFVDASSDPGKGQREQVVDLFIRRHGMETLRSAYPGMQDKDIRELLITTGISGNRYYPYVEFINAPFVSPTVLIRPEGYRVIGRDQAPWPPPSTGKTVFLFGGSTALGSGVLSHQTIAGYLQKWLRANFTETVNVYNFGTGAHYSTQEILFFFDFLRRGFRPDLVVFVDGLNEYAFVNDRSSLSMFLEQTYDRLLYSISRDPRKSPAGVMEHLRQLVLALPLTRFLAHRNDDPTGAVIRGVPQELRYDADFSQLRRPATTEEIQASKVVLDRYQTNLRTAAGMGEANGVATFFVWQPVPLYKYDLRLHPFAVEAQHQLHRVGYPLMAARVAAGELPKDFAWCADVQEGRTEVLYVDQVHYRPLLSELIAKCTVENLISSGTAGRLGWSRAAPDRLIAPDLSEDMATPATTKTLIDLGVIAEREPGRLFATNVSFVATSGGASGQSVRLAADGGKGEHYLVISTELAEPGEYTLSMRVRPSNASSFRIQAWDKDSKPNGVIADVQFSGERVSLQKTGAAETVVGQVIRRGDTYDVAIAAKLPAGLQRVIIQMLGMDGLSTLTPNGETLTISDFKVEQSQH